MRIFNSFIVILILTALLLVQDAEAQLTGVKTVKAAGGTYSTLTAAITDLNTNGVGAGGVTFNVEAGFTESITAPLLITATGTSLNLITFQKDPTTTGDNPKITRTDAGSKITTAIGGDGDAIIQLNGSDYMIFNGIDVQSDQSTIDYGYYTYKPSGTDGCQNIIIKNCTITMIKSTAYNVVIGIYISNGPTSLSSSTGVTVTDYSGRNENFDVSNNLIQNVNQGIYAVGYNHTVSPYEFYDQNVTIGKPGAGNTIQNFQWSGTSGSSYGIYSAYSNNFNASYNYLNNTAGGGAASTCFFYAIYSSYTKATTITYSYNTFNLTTSGTRAAYAFGNNAGDASSTFNVHHNTLENCVHGSSGVFSAFNNGVSSITLNLYSNTVRNNTINAGSSAMFTLGSVDTANVYDNIVSNNTITGGTSTNTAFTISGTGVVNMFRNSIFGYTSTAVAPVYAISISGGKEVKVYNNLIYDIKTIYSHATTDAIRGISITSTTATSNIGIYYNTIYLDASAGGADFWTSCVFHTFNTTATTASLDMRNNILVNATTPIGVGKTNAFRRSASTDLNNYNTSSNNNLFYAGTPGVNNLIYFDGTNSYQTLADFKTAVGPSREAVSVTELPPFMNVTTIPYDIHINSAIPTQCESGAANVATITDDFDGNIRQGNPGYTGTGTAPDIGADEFEISMLSVILYSPANNSTNNPTSLNLVWSKPNSAILYNVVIAWDSSFANIYINDSTLTDTVKAISGLSNNTKYYWKARAKNGIGWGSFSPTWSFTTILPVPAIPTLLSPANNSIDLSLIPTLDWNDVMTASSYRVQISTSNAFGTTVYDTAGLTVSTMAVPAGKLTTNTVYYWRVNATNISGTSSYSTVWSFTTAPNAPNGTILALPSNGAIGQPTTVTFKWYKAIETLLDTKLPINKIEEDSSPDIISKYWFEYGTDPTLATVIGRDSSLTDTTKVMSGLNTGTTYYWRVKAKNQIGWGNFSSIWSFSTLVPTLSLNLKVYLEGFWGGTTHVSDTVMVYLANSTSFAFVDTAKVVLSGTGTASMNFIGVTTGSYYIVVNHRNHLETWSKLPQSFVGGTPLTYDFTTAMTQAFGDNMKQVGSVWVLFGGDANRDGSIDGLDVTLLVPQFGTQGYLAADFDGDQDVTGLDVALFVPNFGMTKVVPTLVVVPVIKTKDFDYSKIDSRQIQKDTKKQNKSVQDKNTKKPETGKNNQ